MKKCTGISTLLASVLLLCTACPTVQAADGLYYFGIIGNETFQDMQILDDKGTLQYGILYTYSYNGEDTPYYLCTYHLDEYHVRNYVDSETGETWQETIHATGDPMYLVVPRSDVIRFVFCSGLDINTAVEQATAIVQKYFPDPDLHYAFENFYEIKVKDETIRTAEASESLMHDLAEAGLISAFYSWGETAEYLEVEHGYLTAYNPAEWVWAEQEYDWDAIEAWVKAEHPECVFACVTDKESDLAKQLGIGRNAFMSQGDTFYAIIPPEGTSFPEHYALAMELYEQFALTPNAYPTPKESGNPTLTGQNALAVAGDVTLDCSVDVSDAVLTARFCAEDREAVITDQGKQNADVNQDGNITLLDVTAILRKIAKLD